MTASVADPSAFIARAREALAKMDRDAPGFPSPLPWYVSGERPMVWADDGDALVSIGARDETPYIEPAVAALIVLAVNALPALVAVAEAAARYRAAADAQEEIASNRGRWGSQDCEAASLGMIAAEEALDAALAALAEVPGE